MREVHSTYYKIRHRITGLFLQDKEGKSWTSRGRLFKNKSALHGFLKSLPEIPKEWELVPVELVVRDDRTMNLKSYFVFWKANKGNKK